MSTPIPLHPEAVVDDERSLRWVVPAGTLGFVGEVARAPQCLQELVDDGTLGALSVEPAAVRTRLVHGQWRAQGQRVRSALQEALAHPVQWRPVVVGSEEDVLRMAVQEVVDGEVGDYIRSHGGQVSVVGVHGNDVEVSLSGSCSHCPASDLTLTTRLETAVRARYPALGAMTARDGGGGGSVASGLRRHLSLTPLRRS